MTERTSGLHRLVTWPRAYAAIQNVLAGDAARRALQERLFLDLDGARLIELGCGPGTWAPYLPNVATYVGVDRNPRHIARARARDALPGARFICADVADPGFLVDEAPFDVALIVGVVHHLTDAQAAAALDGLASRLRPGGRLLVVEPVRHPGQHPVARLLKALDSGRAIRDEAGYRALVAPRFPRIAVEIATDLMRVPYSHLLLRAERP
jgi:SAM-dependent methyltransferase